MKAGAWHCEKCVEAELCDAELAKGNMERSEGSRNVPLQNWDEQKETKDTREFVESYDQPSSLPLLPSVKISLCPTEAGALRP